MGGLLLSIKEVPITNESLCCCCACRQSYEYKIRISHICARTSTKYTKPPITLQQIIESKQGFNEFARHCSKEFRIESFLFFVETHQWLNTLLQQDDYKEFVADHDQLIDIHLPRSAPRSSILCTESKVSCIEIAPQVQEDMEMEMDDLDDCGKLSLPSDEEYMQCAMIFEKYVPDSSYFCINIDGPTRCLLMKQFGGEDGTKNVEYYAQVLKENGMTKEELFHVFDPCRFGIYRLLMSAFTRFKPTPQYQKGIAVVENTTQSPVRQDSPSTNT
eukprot:1027820_1